MTLGTFVVRNTFRNKRRSLLTMISIGFSLLLLTLMICIWRSFYVDKVAPEASRRLIVRDRVSMAFFLPAYYRDKIRSVPLSTRCQRGSKSSGNKGSRRRRRSEILFNGGIIKAMTSTTKNES